MACQIAVIIQQMSVTVALLVIMGDHFLYLPKIIQRLIKIRASFKRYQRATLQKIFEVKIDQYEKCEGERIHLQDYFYWGIEIEEKTTVSLRSGDFKNDKLTMIVGPVGSGKSSLIKSLSVSLNPSEGKKSRESDKLGKIISVFRARNFGYLIVL